MKYILGHNHRAVWKDLGDSFVHTLWADKSHLKSSTWNSSVPEEVTAWDQHETSPSWTLLRTNKQHRTFSSKVQLKHSSVCPMQTCVIRCMVSALKSVIRKVREQLNDGKIRWFHSYFRDGNEHFLAWEAIVYFSSLKYVNSLRRLLHPAEACTNSCAEDKDGFYE